MEAFGRIDVLVNNAGEQHVCEDFLKLNLDTMEKTFRTNIFSMFYLTQVNMTYHGPRLVDHVLHACDTTAYLVEVAPLIRPRFPPHLNCRLGCRAVFCVCAGGLGEDAGRVGDHQHHLHHRLQGHALTRRLLLHQGQSTLHWEEGAEQTLAHVLLPCRGHDKDGVWPGASSSY